MHSHVENIFENLIQYPAVVIDRQNEIVYINSKFKDEFGLDDDEKAEKAVKELFGETAYTEKLETALSSDDHQDFIWENIGIAEGLNYKLQLYPLKLENEEYLITLFELADLESNKKVKFSINYSDVQSYVKNNTLHEIVNTVKSSFPFTFIGKQKFQKTIDALPNKFWIKDKEQNLIIANKEFIAGFELEQSQLASKSFSDLLDEVDFEAIRSAEQFLLNSSRPVIIDIVYSKDEKHEVIIELPLIDIDENVVAIVGFTDLVGLGKPARSILEVKVLSRLVKNIGQPFLLIDNYLKIVNYNTEFAELFNLESEDLIGLNILEELPEGVTQQIQSFTESDQNETEVIIEENEEIKEELHLSLSRISDDEKDLGYYICCDAQNNYYKNDLKGKMYDILMQTSPEPIFIYDIENLKFIEVNHAALTLYGYTREEFLEMDLTDLYAPEDIQTLIESSPDKATSSEFSGPWRHRHKDGSTILVVISKSTLELEGTKAHFNIVKVVTDLLEEKQLLQTYKSVYENASDPVITTDEDGFITSANSAALNLLDYAMKDLKNKPFLSLVSDSNRVQVNSEIFHTALAQTVSFKIAVKSSSGDLHDAEIYAEPVKDYSGEVSSYTILLKVKTSAPPAPVEQDDEEESGNLDKTFLANLFHELLTPVNVIVGFTRELSDSIQNPNEDQKESVEIINDNQKLLLQIMDNAVEYASIEQDDVEINVENLTFIEILEDIEDNIKKFSEFNNVDFSYGKISSSLKFETDRAKLISLLTMWIKFSIQATDRKKVYLSAYSAENDYTFISINDERSAISKELFEDLQFIYTEEETLVKQKYGISRFTVRLARKLIHVLGGTKEVVYKGGEPVEFGFKFPMNFTPYKPADTETPAEDKKAAEEAAEAPQTIVKDEVEEVVAEPVEDSVKVEETAAPEPVQQSAPQVDMTSQSTTINVTVQAPASEEPAKPAEPEPQPVAEEPEAEKPFDMSGMSCLYVEDQVDSQILFKVQMKGLRSIEFATSFEKALPMIESKPFDFIVMDINLQGEYNGLDALRAIQKMPGHENLPIIAVTAYVLPGDREKFIAAGFSDFISKPILRDKVENILKKIFN